MRHFLHLVYLAAAILLAPSAASAQERDSLRFIILMKGGDSFRGNPVRYTDSTVTLMTEFDHVTVPKSLIERLIPAEGPYRKRPLHFLMPSASPNGPGGFLSDYQLGFLYGGLGIGEQTTLTAGMTIVPGISLASQFYHLGLKYSASPTRNLTRSEEEVQFAAGATMSWFTGENPQGHLYGVITFPYGWGRASLMLHYRVAGKSVIPIALQAFDYDTSRFTLNYGSWLGMAAGFDVRAFGRDDMTWVGEIWNLNLTDPVTSAIMFGLRVNNERFAGDLGLVATITEKPYLFPVISFTWRVD